MGVEIACVELNHLTYQPDIDCCQHQLEKSFEKSQKLPMEEREGLVSGKAKIQNEGTFFQLFRFFLLIVIALVCFGNYFDYDIIEPWQTQLEQVGYTYINFSRL